MPSSDSHMEYAATLSSDIITPTNVPAGPIPPPGYGWRLVSSITFPMANSKVGLGVIWYFERHIPIDEE